MSEKITAMIEEIKALSVLELSELVKAIEEEFGVSAAAPVAVVGGAVAGGAAAADTLNSSSIAFTNSDNSKTVRALISSIIAVIFSLILFSS